jgi:hypothetical protein
MANTTSLSGRALGRIGLAAIVLWAVPSFLWSQGASVSQQAHPSTGQPFAGFDDSLATVADRLLPSTTQTTSQTSGEINMDNPSFARLAMHDVPRSQPWGEVGLSVAAVRLNLLRLAVEPLFAASCR